MSEERARRVFNGVISNYVRAEQGAKASEKARATRQRESEFSNEKNEKFLALFGETFAVVVTNLTAGTYEYFVQHLDREWKVVSIDPQGSLNIVRENAKKVISFRGAESGRVEEK